MKNNLLFKKAGSLLFWSFALLILLISGKGYGQIGMSSTGSHTQNFNTLSSSAGATWTDNSTISNWYSQRTGTGTTYVVDAGSGTAGALYSYGSASASDRAIGALGSSNAAAGSFAHGVLLRNTSGSAITDIKVTYTLEEWRNGGAGAAQPITFWYKISTSSITALNANSNSTWTQVTGLTLNSPINTASAGALDGNATANKVTATNVSIPSLSLANNSYIMLKWEDPDHSGTDSGLSIDDVTVSWTTVSNVNPTFNAFSNVTKNYGDANGFTMTTSSDNTVGAISYSSLNTAVATINSSTGAVTIKGVGTATILASQAASAGFNSGSTSATLTVNAATTGLIITANGVSKTYGTTLSNGSSTAFTVSGLLYSDTLGSGATVTNTYGTGASASDSATLSAVSPAVYVNSVTPSALVNGSGATYNAANYAAATYMFGDITVSKANQSITFASTASKTYGDADYSPGATSATSGVNAITYSSDTAATATIVSGNIHITGAGTAIITASQAGNDDYNAAASVNQNLTVTTKSLTVTGLIASSKPYDGNTDAVVTGTAALSGVVSGDEANVSLDGTPTAVFTSSAVGTNIPVHVTGYSISGSAAGNYSLVQPTTLAADIIATTPTIFASGTLSAVSTTYGTASAATSFSVSGQSLTEGILVSPPAGFEVSLSSGSGYGTTVTVGGAGNVSSTTVYVRLAATTTAGTYSGDITLSSTGAVSVTVATVNSTVNPKALTITGLTGVDKTYDGTTTATVTGTASLSGVVGSDDVNLVGSTPSYAFATADAGTNKAITVLGYSLNGTAAGNYSLTQPAGLTATIAKAASSISVTGSNSFTYNAAAQGPNTSSVTGSTGAISYSYNGVSPAYGPSATRPTNAGSYTVAATVAADTNYESATSASFSFSIAKADQTITLAGTDTRTTATTTYTLTQNASSGLAVSYVSSNPAVATISGNTVTITGAGTTTITANQAGNDNYNAAPEATQALTVTQPACSSASSTVSWNFGTSTGNLSPSSSAVANLAVSVISRGNDLAANGTGFNTTTSSSSSPFSGQFNVGITAKNSSFSSSTSGYFEFTLTGTAGYKMSLNGVSFGNRSTSSGPSTVDVRTSADGFAASIGTASSLTTGVFATLTPAITPVSISGAGTLTVRIYGYVTGGTGTVISGNAINWRMDDLALTVSLSNEPSAATAGAAQSVCGLTSTALGGNTPGVGTGTWSQVSGPGTSSFSSIHSGSSTATASVIGTYVYRWSINNGCATTNTADITVTYNEATSNTTTASACGTYHWSVNGADYAASGTYSVVTGCHTEVLALTITPNTTTTTTISACDTYHWSVNGVDYTESGTYSVVSGCHTEVLALTITPSSTSEVTASACDTYHWSFNGQDYTESGDYTNTVGCSTTTLHLTITPSTSNTTTASACDIYRWAVNNQDYTASGTYSVVTGCHTEILALTITPSTSNTTTASACDTYHWSVNGADYTASGTYSVVSGCHTEILALTITPSTSNTTTASACDTYHWALNDADYTASGTYSVVTGCHTEVLALTITPSTSNTTTASACDTYHWALNDADYTASGTYSVVTGCHTEILALTITPSTSNTTTASACDTYHWALNDADYTASGTYSVVTGCHTEILALTITPSTSNTTTASACDTYHWGVNDEDYTESGTYTEVRDCHTEVLVLTITPSTSNTTTASACDTYHWSVNGADYTASGTYSVVTGCHTEVLALTITPSTSHTTTASACDTYHWSVNGADYTASGTYSVVSGCHTEVLALTITPSTSNTTTASACDTYHWSVNGADYTASGTYSVVTGCHTEVLALTITPSTSNTTTASATGSYTWDVNEQNYTASGTYTVVTGCHTEILILTINSATGTITAQPANAIICSTAGSTATYTVASTMVNATYTWQYRVITKTATDPAWITITSANAAVYSNYNTATLTVTRTATLPAAGTQYRVLITGDSPALTSNTATVTVLSTTKAGSITMPSTTVCEGNNLTFTVAGYAGSSIQWQSSPVSTTAAPGVFTDIPGATGTTYTLTDAQLTSDRSYRVVVSNSCTGIPATSATKTITVNAPSVAGTITGGGTVCTTGAGTLKVAGYLGKVQWEYSTDGGNTYSNAPKAADGQVTPFSTTTGNSTGATYMVTNITADLSFRVKVTNGACSSSYSVPVQFTVGSTAVVGSVTPESETLCPATGTTLTLSGTSVGTTTWQKSTNWASATPTWASTTNHSTSYATGNLTASTAYRVASTIGTCSTVYSNLAIITIVAKPVAKPIAKSVTSPTGNSATTPICNGSTPAKTLTLGAGYVGNVQWQHSVTTGTAGFTDIAGAVFGSYSIANPAIGANYYRARLSNSCGAEVFSAIAIVYYKDCDNSGGNSGGGDIVKVARSFNVVAYPNPYTENFNLDLSTSSEETVGVMVYDMTGRLIDKREVSPSDVAELQVGDRYPSGVYNVVVTQGSEVKTLRVIKR